MSNQEGDAILFGALKDAGFNLEVSKVADITAEILVAILSKCLYLISEGDLVAPASLSTNVASRHRVCTDIALKIKQIGCPVKCGYNELLYPAETTTRNLLLWMVQKLPRPDGDAEEVLTPEALLRRRAREAFVKANQQPWMLPHSVHGRPVRNIYKQINLRTSPWATIKNKDMMNICRWCYKQKPNGQATIDTFIELHSWELSKDQDLDKSIMTGLDNTNNDKIDSKNVTKMAFQKARVTHTGNALMDQLNKSYDDIITKVTSNASSGGGILKKSRFEHAAQFAEESSAGIASTSELANNKNSSTGENVNETLEEAKARKDREQAEARAKEADELKRNLAEEIARLQTMELAIMEANMVADKADKSAQEMSDSLEELRKDVRTKKEAIAMLPKAEENIKKMQQVVSAQEARLVELQKQWDEYEKNVLLRLEKARTATEDRRRRCAEMIEDYKNLRLKTQELVQDKKSKQKMATILLKELDKLPNIDRGMYTHRIMEIMNQIRQQDDQISVITNDIRDTQKAINTASSGVSRADAVAEEKLYSRVSEMEKSAHFKQHKNGIDAYKYLMDLRETFKSLVDTVTEIGSTDKISSDLEVKIHQETARISTSNYNRIKADLLKIKQENKAMFEKVQQKTKGR